jgi:hypothetical protein
MMVEGQTIGNWFFRVNLQPEVGDEAFDRGAMILQEFFASQIKQFLEPDLHPMGKTIIDYCLSGASLEDYESLIPYPIISDED